MLRRCTRLLPLIALLLPRAAYAQQANLTCAGPVPAGNLYNTANVCSGVTSLQNIFTGLVCNFQILLNAIMGNVYCGIQFSLRQPLAIALVLFIIVFGIQIITGHTQARISDIFMRVFKMTLIWVFATNATYGIGIAYNFFMNAANSGVGMVFSVIPLPAATAGGFCNPPTFNPGLYVQGQAFAYLDYMLCTIITGPFTQQGAMLSGFFAIMAWMIPPIFMMFSYFFIKSIKILIRALFSYLLAISSIAFLITMSPLFISFALFGPTRHFFDDWLRFLVSYTLQIILIFAGVAMWLTVILQLTGFLGDLTTMIRPVQETTMQEDLLMPLNTWGICQYSQVQTYWGPILQCADQCMDPPQCTQYSPDPIPPTDLVKHDDFIYFLIINLIAISTVAYTFDALMTMLPSLAKQLSGPGQAPQVGGGGGMGAAHFGDWISLESTGGQAHNFTEAIRNMLGKRPGGNTNKGDDPGG